MAKNPLESLSSFFLQREKFIENLVDKKKENHWKSLQVNLDYIFNRKNAYIYCFNSCYQNGIPLVVCYKSLFILDQIMCSFKYHWEKVKHIILVCIFIASKFHANENKQLNFQQIFAISKGSFSKSELLKVEKEIFENMQFSIHRKTLYEDVIELFHKTEIMSFLIFHFGSKDVYKVI